MPYWYLPTKLASSLRNKMTSPSLKSKSVLNHFGCLINCGTHDISHASNQQLKMSSLALRKVAGLPVTNIDPTGLLSLFRPNLRRLGVIKSIFSRSETKLPNASGRSLMELLTCAPNVSHRMIDNLSFCRDFMRDSFILLILRSTRPLMLWQGRAQTQHCDLNVAYSLYPDNSTSSTDIPLQAGFLHQVASSWGSRLHRRIV